MKITYFKNRYEDGASELAEKMRKAGIDFSCLPTSGPSTLYINGHSHYGPTAVKRAVDHLVQRMEKSHDEQNSSI